MLDLRQDRYVALPPEWAACLTGLRTQTRESVCDEPRPESLLRAGVIEVSTSDNLEPCSLRSGEMSLAGPKRQPKMIMVLSATYSLFQTRRLLAAHSLDEVVCKFAREKMNKTRPAPSGDIDNLSMLATAFGRAEVMSTRHDRCLSRSFALAFAAVQTGFPVDLVIGVRARPFAAHCWVQWDGRIVNDEVEMIRAYTPILAV